LAKVELGSPERFCPTPWRHGCDDFAAHEWRLVTLAPGSEQRFAYELLKRAHPHYIPMVECEVERRGRRVMSRRFAFPGYAFASTPPGDAEWPVLHRCRYGVQYIWDQATIVSDLIKLDAMGRANMPAVRTAEPVAGDPVRIRSGPCEGRMGRYLRPGRKGALVLEIHTLGAAFPVSVQGRDVERVA